MKGFANEAIRNVAVLGHSSSGKTTFLESLLFDTKAIGKMGNPGSTVSDYDKMEKEKGYSIGASIIPVIWNNKKINFIDTPGFFDFVGEMNASLKAVEAAAIIVDAAKGPEVGTEQAWKACERDGVPKFFIFSNKEKGAFDFDAAFGALKDKFGDTLVPMSWPLAIDDIDDEVQEALANSDDELMEKYFEGEEFTEEEIKRGFAAGILAGTIVPVFKTAFEVGQSSEAIFNFLFENVPSPTARNPYIAKKDGEDTEVVCKADGPATGFVFKTINDPFVGKISVIKLVTGKIAAGSEMVNQRTGKSEKFGKLLFLRGNQQEHMESAVAGEIFAVAKLDTTLSGDSLCEKGADLEFAPLGYPTPKLYFAIEASDKKQEDKVFSGLNKLAEEDPSFTIERNAETKQSLLGGQGDQQLKIVMDKLKDRFNVTVDIIPQKIAYRETIRGCSDVQGKHKKQSGGAGQYGDVHIKFSPSDQEFEFVETLFGGSVPKNYVPAVEKGLLESMEKGPLAGCKVQGVKADLYDGSYHPVDSNEMAFKIAASLAFKKGIVEAKPCLLEPIMHLDIIIPDENMGDIMGDMNKRRGRILGSEPLASGDQKIIAEAPQAELFDYAITVRSMTQGRGSFDMSFDRYEPMPNMMADKVIEAYKAEQEAAK